MNQSSIIDCTAIDDNDIDGLVMMNIDAFACMACNCDISLCAAYMGYTMTMHGVYEYGVNEIILNGSTEANMQHQYQRSSIGLIDWLVGHSFIRSSSN